MDWSAERYPWLYLLLGFVMVSVWSVISLAHAHQRTLASVNDSFTQGSMITERLGAILDDLARLSVDQQAFLSTGDMRFQDGVIESSEGLTLDVGVLNDVAAKGKLRPPLLASLSRSVDQVLAAVGESDRIADTRSRAAAVEFFESRQDTIAQARQEASQLRVAINGSISDRIRVARTTRAFLQDLLYVAPGTGLKHGARWSNVALRDRAQPAVR